MSARAPLSAAAAAYIAAGLWALEGEAAAGRLAAALKAGHDLRGPYHQETRRLRSAAPPKKRLLVAALGGGTFAGRSEDWPAAMRQVFEALGSAACIEAMEASARNLAAWEAWRRQGRPA